MRLVVAGDLLLDVDVDGRAERLSPDAPVPVLDQSRARERPGGAGLAAVLAIGDRCEVRLVTAVGRDRPGERLRSLLTDRGVELVDLGLDGPTPEKVRFRAVGRSLMRLDRGGGGTVAGAGGALVRAALQDADAVLVSDYGRGVAAEPALRDALRGAAGRVPVVWDPHPRGPAPAPGLAVATPNEGEVARLQPSPSGAGAAEAFERARDLRRRWQVHALCMTRGTAGAVLVRDGRPPLAAPAPAVEHGDPCGAGDRFASRLTCMLASGARLDDATVEAVASASRFVAAGGAAAVAGGAPDRDAPEDAIALARRVARAGGTVVATGGCFDLLHAGHVRTLEAARRLGDALIVCLNSDRSVARIKGADRPLVPQEDRAAVLAALGCVDAVEIFDEDTPERALERLRPAVWVKGGDYDGAELPEERALRRWGGRAVLVPYVEGRSTTKLIEEAACRV